MDTLPMKLIALSIVVLAGCGALSTESIQQNYQDMEDCYHLSQLSPAGPERQKAQNDCLRERMKR